MPSELRIEMSMAGSSTLVDLSGYLDHTTVARLSKAIRTSLNHNTVEVVLDLGKVAWLDSVAMGQFMMYRQLLEKKDRKLVLANCKGTLLAALRLVNFHKLLEIR
jgi:anti-anti-sigma factor